MRKNASFSAEDKIQTLEEELATAAEAGLALLKSNQELQERCEKEALFYQKQIEVIYTIIPHHVVFVFEFACTCIIVSLS